MKTLSTPQRGLTLVELLISMMLGLLLLLGVMSVYLANRQAYRTTENLNHLQNNVRVAMELMARDIREAGGTPCGSYMIDQNESVDWLDWDDGGIQADSGESVLGGVDFGETQGDRIEDTEAILIQTASMGAGVRMLGFTPGSFTVSSNNGIGTGSVIVACDMRMTGIFTVTGSSASAINYESSVFDKTFTPVIDGKDAGAYINEVRSILWYIGHNGRGGRALYRRENGSDNYLEVADGVWDLESKYLVSGATSYSDLSSPPTWTDNTVKAVQLTLTVRSRESVDTESEQLERKSYQVVNLRPQERVE